MSNNQNANQGGQTGEKLFTQAEVDVIVKERLERERKRYSADADTMTELQTQLAKVEAELQQVKTSKEEQESAYKAEKIENGIIKELEKVRAVNTSALKDLFTKCTNMEEDGSLTVAGEDGASKPLSEHVSEWAKHNNWAIKSLSGCIPGGNAEGFPPREYHAEDGNLRQAFGLIKEE